MIAKFEGYGTHKKCVRFMQHATIENVQKWIQEEQKCQKTTMYV
jgi:hypothetical protein